MNKNIKNRCLSKLFYVLKRVRSFLKGLIFVILIPLIIAELADFSVRLSCKYYWGEEFLRGHLGFKLGMMVVGLTYSLTFVYYLFGLLFKLFRSVKARVYLTVLFFCLPVLYYDGGSSYDYRLTICFGLFNASYYLLFYLFRFMFNRFFETIRDVNKNKGI